MTFDRDELAALLLQAFEGRQESPQDEPNTITTQEFAEASGMREMKARDLLKAAHKAGLVTPAKVVRVTIHGDAIRRPGWRFVNPPESPD